jgi:hypothetical protein
LGDVKVVRVYLQKLQRCHPTAPTIEVAASNSEDFQVMKGWPEAAVKSEPISQIEDRAKNVVQVEQDGEMFRRRVASRVLEIHVSLRLL